ncbi:hypothetical protein [Streptomyces sp. NPDC001678]|uniref:hypothetical protein n=1 Tax=Streptomyces sp. NPDC001678 TaxID=3364599 RepID=UPI00367593C9
MAVAVLAGSALAPTAAFAAGSHGARTASPADPSADQCTVVKNDHVGAGTGIRMTMSPQGPSVEFYDWADGSRITRLGTLDRVHPKLPDSAGIYEEIVGAHQLEPSTEVEDRGWSRWVRVPRRAKMPKGCPLH